MTQDEKARAAKSQAAIEGLPTSVRERLAELARGLEEALGDDLVGVLIHGSVARGEYRHGESDVDAVVVVKTASLEALESISNALQLARYAARVEAMILTEDEIPGASDAFPLLYDDIKRRHVVLVGRDPFADVVVHDTHRRLRIEQELREAQIRLRRAVTDAGGTRAVIGMAVARKLRQVRGTLRALFVLKGMPCDDAMSSVLSSAKEAYAVDVAPLKAPREDPAAAHAAIVELLERAIRDVNGMETAPGAGA